MLFSQMLDRMKHEVITILAKVQVRAESDVAAVEEHDVPMCRWNIA